MSDQVHKQFTVNAGSFENINLGSGKRPTELIRQYGNLYTDGRVDAMDALNSFTQLGDLDVLKMKILFSVIVVRVAGTFLHGVTICWFHSINVGFRFSRSCWKLL